MKGSSKLDLSTVTIELGQKIPLLLSKQRRPQQKFRPSLN